MTVVTWSDLPKSQEDDETIEEAIARLVQTHLDDENAHIEEGESLYTHKDQEVIDHPADSVVTDKIPNEDIENPKIQRLARAHKAIFDSAGGGDYTDLQTAVDYVNGIGGGSILIKDGDHTIEQQIDIPSEISLIGQSIADTILKMPDKEYTTGTAEFTNGSAIVAGTNTEWLSSKLKAGDYIKLNADDEIYIIESVDNDTQITLIKEYEYTGGSGAYTATIKPRLIIGHDNTRYSTGTIAITEDSDQVIGTDTVWSTNVEAGDFISILDILYEVESVDDNTTITLIETYQGHTLSGLKYYAGPFNQDIEIKNLTIEKATQTSGPIRFIQSRNCLIEKVRSRENGDGMSLHYCDSITVQHCDLSHNNIGLGNGIKLTYCSNCNIIYNTINNNTFRGIEVDNLHGGNNIIGNTVSANDAGGISLDVVTDRKTLGNIVSGNNCSANAGHGIYILRFDYATISNNICNDNKNDGICIESTSYAIIIGNTCYNNGDDGICIAAAGDREANIITGNICENNTDKGIVISSTAIETIVTNNILRNNGTNLSDPGIDTQLGHNIEK